jgi:hypothetical protein
VVVVVVVVVDSFASWVTVFVIFAVLFTRHCNWLDAVGVGFMCVCYVYIGVWFEFAGACSRVGVFANFVVLAVVVFVAGGAASFLVVYQKTSADDRALLLHPFLLLGLRLLKYLTSKKRLLCHLGLRFLFHLV